MRDVLMFIHKIHELGILPAEGAVGESSALGAHSFHLCG